MDVHDRVRNLEAKVLNSDLEKLNRAYEISGILKGLAIACFICAIVLYVRGSNS